MKKYLILILILGVSIASCKKYEVQYGMGTASTTVLQDDVYDIAYSTEEGVFLINAAMTRSKMLVSFANAFSPRAGRVALSRNKDKVAYVSPNNGIPIIVDTLGNVLIELTQYTNVQDLGWHNEDETLYILSNNQVQFYGPSLDLPSPLFSIPSNAYDYEITTIDINEHLDVVYGAIYYEYSGNYRDWYYSYNLNYKSLFSTDIDYTNQYGSHYYIQNVGADSRRVYHTMRFLDSQDRNEPVRTVSAFASGTRFDLRFEDSYQFRENGFELGIDEDGYLFKKAVSNNTTYEARLWHIDSDEAPLYVDWVTGF